MPTTIPDKLIDVLLKKNLSKTSMQVLLFLLSSSDRPLSTADISGAIGVSGKAVCKAVKRLVDSGIIHPGEPEAKRRRFLIPGADRGDAVDIPEAITHPEIGRMLDRIEELEQEISDMSKKETQMTERIERTEAALSSLIALIGTPDGSKSIHNTSKAEQTIPLSLPGAAVTVPEVDIQNVTTNPPIIASSLAMLLNNSKASCLHQHEEFKNLFGVDVPIGADQMAVAEMIRRRKAGKLDNVKSPLAYLSSISGKVTAPAPAVINVPVYAPAVDNDMEVRSAINQIWAKMTDDEVEPYRQKAKEKQFADGHKKVPIEILTRQVFNIEQMAKRGISI